MPFVGKITDSAGNTGLIGSTLYGTCATEAATVAKVVTLSDFDKLMNGVTIHVKFTYSNTAASPTLNVNSTGAKSIYKYGTTVPGTTVAASWPAGSIVSFTYDGTSWIMNDYHDDTNTDTKVTQAYSTTDNAYPVLLSSVAGISSTASRGDQTSIVNNQIYANPSSGRLYAKIPEAFLFWGGKDFAGSYGPIDAAMIPTLSANRAAFYPGDRIVVEYTRDGGTTWLDYGADNTTKTALFTTGASFVVGKSTTSNIATPSCKLRITIKNTMGKLYSSIQKIAIYVSTGGSTGCTVDIKGRTRTNVEAESDTWANLKTAVPISGYSGWNILQTSFTTYGNSSNKSSQYDEIRFIFSITSHGSSAAGLSVSKIYMYGGVGWQTPSTLASTGLIYSYDASQNVVFPAKVTSNSMATSSGDITCGGTFIAKADVYTDALSSGALNMRNSDIYGCNSIKFADLCDNGAEGIQFYRDGTHADSFYGKSGKLYYHPNRAYGSTAGDVYTILHTGNLAITQSLTSGTKIGTITIDGTGTDLYAPSHTHPYLPLAGGTMDDGAEITIPDGSHSSQYTGFGMYHYIGAGNGWARGINVNSAADGTRIGSLGMYGTADATEPLYAYFGKTYNDAWYYLYKNIFRIQDAEDSDFQFQYKPASLSSSYIGSFLSLYSGSAYGYGIVLGHSHGGMTVVGGGESAKAICETFFDSSTTPYPSAFTYDSEELIMCSDYGIWFVSGAQNLKTTSHTDWVDLTTALFDNTGNFRPSIDDKGSIGSASYRWNSIHGTTFYENGISLVNKYAAIDHTHSTLNVGNVGNSNTPVYFSNGAPTVVTVPVSGAWWSSEPHIDSSGVLEIGRYIDFHATNTSTNNYDMRFDATSTSILTLASQSGSTTLRISGTLPMLRFQQTTSGKAYDNSSFGIWCRPADTNGANMFMQSGGCIMIGAGEFAANAYSRKDETGTTQIGYDNIDNSTAERLYLGADGEIHIISNGQNIGTYTNNDHNVWKFKTDGMLVTPGSITNLGSGSYHTFIKQDTRSTSHCTTLVEWYTGGVRQETEFQPSISYHNLGGPTNNPGAIILLPYATDTNTWGGSVGLYIAKDILKLDGVNVVRETGTMDFTGNIGISSRGRGYYLTDRTDFQYPLGYDNGANLWIGATQTSAQHHTGQTFISAGYNATDGVGNPTIYVAVPNATNTSATTYRVFHSGNLFYQVESNENAWSSINIPTSSGSQIFAFHTGAASATPSFTAGIYSNGLVYGMLDTKGFISNAYNTPKVTFGGGLADSSHTAPTWYFALSGTSEKNYDLDDMRLQSGYHYQPISTWSDTPWHKILSFNIDAAGTSRSIALLVYGSYTSMSGQIAGILFIRASTNSNKNFNSASIKWASSVRNITQSNFVLAYTNNGTTSTTFELYWKQDQQYTTLKFVQLSARALNGKDFEAITYYKDDTGTAPGIAAIPSTVTGTIASTSMSHHLEESSAADIGYYVNRTDTGVSCWFGVGSGGTNHGIYSSKLGSWMVYGTASDVLLRTKLYNPTTEANTLAISFYGAQPSTGVKALYNNNGLRYTTREGTTSQLGYGSLVLGNATASGTAGNKYGRLRLYSQGANCGDIITDTLTGTREYKLPDRSGEIQVSVGQELIFDGSMTRTSTYFDVTIDNFFTKYRVILIEVLGLKYNSTEYCFKSVWPVKFIENLSGMGHHFLTIETTGNSADKLLITKNTDGFKLTTYSGGSFPTTASVRVYSLL